MTTLVLGGPQALGARQTAWRAAFAAGEEARRAGDLEAYAAKMAEAVAGMPTGLLNRPFAQYHAARANALLGRPGEAVRFLRMAWDEGLESLMISYATHDPAFDAMREDPDLVEVLGRGERTELATVPLGGGVTLLTGAGANLVTMVGPEGALLVDTGYRPALEPLRRALAALGASSVSLLVLTHAHEDHVGSVDDLGPEAFVVGHEAAAATLAEPSVFIEGVELPPKTRGGRPDLTLTEDTTFLFAGREVRLHPLPAHTGGDLAVHLPEARVLVMGDAYLGGNPMMFPGTADPDGFLDGLEGWIEEMHPETVVVGGHDPPTGLPAVRAQIAESRACMAFVREALGDGLTLEQTVERATDRHAAPWVGFFYRLFSAQQGD